MKLGSASSKNGS